METTNNMQGNVDVKSMTKEQRAALLAELQQQEKDDRIARRETYGALRSEFMHEVKTRVTGLVADVRGFRDWLGREADAFTAVMKEYGQVKTEGQSSYTITEVGAPANYDEPDLNFAVYMDEIGNTISTCGDSFSHVITLSPKFRTNDGNIISEHGDVLAYGPFLVGKMTEDGAITLVDSQGIAVAFHLEDGQMQFDYALAPAAYVDEFGRIVTVDFFGRETFLTSPLVNTEAE